MRNKLVILAVFAAVIFSFTKFAISGAVLEKKKNAELFRQVELLSDTLSIIQSDYVDEIKSQDLIYGALKGMLSSLDPHSQFMDPDTYNELKVDTEGKFGGLGIEITIKDSMLTVVTPIEDTPAWKAGIKANDRIVKINTELTRDMTLTDAVKKLRGKAGEPVNIAVLRESEKKLLDFKIVRDIIKIQDIKSARILEDGIGYIRLIEFRENTSEDMDKTLEKLKKDGMNALILDLRNNPGGLLETAVEVTEKFIPKGNLVLSTKGRIASQNMEFFSRYNRPVWDMPLVVLINEGSASGSEIVAAALQDYKRAIIMGTKSFGKGSVQTIIPLADGSALRLTTSKYFTPSSKVIHGKGVMPDITVTDGKLVEAADDKPITETKAQDIFDEIEKKEQAPAEKVLPDYKSDSQLIRAVDVIKAIKIIKAEQKIETK
ncbi:MAG: S41 family peptidase [Candidatus Omnitrophica bacterium]|jgi:carboxyl-terminal processing protease|nr:S41 family peptidase [Candidatus Omnitrophota bacterium]